MASRNILLPLSSKKKNTAEGEMYPAENKMKDYLEQSI